MRTEDAEAFTLAGATSSLTATVLEQTPERPLGAFADAEVDELIFRDHADRAIGHMAFEGGLTASARRDVFGPEDVSGEALDLGPALLAELGASDFVFRGASGSDHLDLSDLVIGWTGRVRLDGAGGQDHLTGGMAGDFIRGGPGRDTLQGGAGDDTLLGNRGRDWLEGGAGDDVLTGGLGRDVFHFGQGDTGQDRITDFRPGRDVLSYSADVADRDALRFEDTAQGLRITQQDGDQVILSGITEAMLRETDFQFG